MKSDCYPGQVPLGAYWAGMNVLNIGGQISCRPGYQCICVLPDGNLQGLFIFHPQEGLEQALVVVDGKVYVAPWPFTDFRQLPGLQFSPYARQVFWCQTLQSAERIDTTFTSAIRVIPPKAVVLIQDGGSSAPAWYDGHNFGHISGRAYETPAGGDMAWVGSRLWVARGNQVFASDISNPFSFRESDYLGGQISFFFRAAVTAMVVTPSTESPQLMVLTDIDGSILQANIQDRSQWTTTINFQEEVIGVGCTGSRAALSHYGRLVWFSPGGVVFYDPALGGKITSRLPVRDNEMLVSKALLSDDLSGVAMGVFGQFLLASVPVEDVYNRHTWVLNHASLATLSDDSGPSWAGYWTGTRPVEWGFGQIANSERIFYVSVDYDGKNRLWEAFKPDRLDSRCPITWAVFTRGFFGSTASIQEKPPGVRCRLAWVDVALAGIEEDINLGVFYAGGTRGAFRQIMNRLFSVQRGSLAFDQELTADTPIYAFKAQSRTTRTEDANQQVPDTEQGGCGVETYDQDNIDRDFQLLIVGHGPATIRWIRPFAFLVPEDLSGSALACESEEPVRAVRFDGVGTRQEDVADAIADLAARPLADFKSQQTITLAEDDFLAVGVGSGESLVSQETADRVAAIVATRMAEMELSALLPPTISTGLGLSPIIYNPFLPSIPASPLPNNATEGDTFTACPAILFAPLPPVTSLAAYSQQLTTAWGVAPVTFSLVSNLLPPGLTMSKTGVISGTTAVPGDYAINVQVTDSTGAHCSQVVPLVVNPILPDWTAIVWDTPETVSPPPGFNFPTVASATGDHLQYSVYSSNLVPTQNPYAKFKGTLSYLGGYGGNAKVTLDINSAGNQSSGDPCLFSLSVVQDGVTLYTMSTSSPHNPPVGSHDFSFTVNPGLGNPSTIVVTAEIENHYQGGSVLISGAATFSNA